MMAHNVVENVVKQGYLKKGNSITTRLSGLFRRNDGHKWFVFTIRRGVPYLEYYDHDVDVFTQQPINSFNLSNCQNVKSLGNSNPTAFCIVCPDRIIELVASSRTQMVGWVNEVEASLVRLGILQLDIADHVYTVCPAVVRKPKPSKNVEDEKDTETNTTEAKTVATSIAASTALTTTTTAVPQDSITQAAGGTDNSHQSNTSPHVSPSLHQRAKTVKQSSVSRPVPLPPRSSMRQHSAPLSGRSDSPPPLPSRPPPLSGGVRLKQRADNAVESSDASTDFPITGSSNDSDFVSAEVIAQLQFLRRGISEGGVSIASRTGAGLLNETQQGPVSQSVKPSNAAPQSNADSHDQSVLSSGADANISDLPVLGSPIQFQNQCDSFANSDSNNDESSSRANSTSPNPDHLLDISAMVGNSHILENDYSALPVKDMDDDGLCYQDDDGLCYQSSGQSQNYFTCVSKPTPLPRKTGSQKLNDSNPNTIESNGQIDEENCNVGSPMESGAQPIENTEKDVAEETYKVDANFNKSSTGDLDGAKQNSSSTNAKEFVHSNDIVKESQQTKDENENFYGLMYDNSSPPTTMAPPVPAVPPLPPRHDSLPHAKDDSELVTSLTELKCSVSVSSSSTIASSASSTAAATSQNEGQADSSSTAAVPPLPRPRKKGPNSEAKRKSLPPLVFADNDGLEVPPMPPRRSSPQSSFSQTDKPPILPARNSQSFFIKRPQLTGMPVSSINNGDTAPAAKTEALCNLALDDQETGASGYQETGQRPAAPGLSSKMRLDRAHSLHTVVSLKQTQADILQTEIDMSNMSMELTQKSGFGLALVEWNSFACVVGWNQKDFPSLHGKLHIGDLIFSVNNVKVTSPELAQKLLKQAMSSKIDIMLHRMPYAKVLAIRRNADGQSLGIKREGGTGEIVYVDPNGLAAQHGLTQYASSAFGNTRCNWFLTEINNRPLNLFFKDSEIEHRLSAVGREISIVVQPCDFIYEIRRKFKKLKNYKNYITQ